MFRLPRRATRLLLRLYPRSYRRQCADELEIAFLACIERERRRAGAVGAAYAWTRLIADTLGAALLMRLDAFQQRRRSSGGDSTRLGDNMFSRLLQDVKYGARALRHAPIFSTTVVLTLALAIAATTAVFSLVDATLLKSLPYREPDRLVHMYQSIPKAIAFPVGFSPPDFLALRERVSSVESIAAYRNREYELSGVDTPERILATRASASLFEVLGVRPAIGTTFTREDDEQGRPVAVISDGLWQRKFAGDPGVIGRALILDRQPYTIAGVMPRGFVFPRRGPLHNSMPAEAYLPISFTPSERVGFGSMYNNSVVARLAGGTTLAQADAEAKTLVRDNAVRLYPAALSGLANAIEAKTVAFPEDVIGRTRPFLLVAFGAVAFVLLIACADVAALMLTRAVSRQREIAVRVAVGAGRARIIRQLLVESAVLAVAAGAIGFLLTWWLAGTAAALAPSTLPGVSDLVIDTRVFLFSAALSFLTAVLCGIIPAFEVSRPAASETLKDSGRTGTPGRRHRRIFGALVVAQTAVAVVLLVGGGLLVRSLVRLLAVEPGFSAERVLTMETNLPAAGYRSGADVRTFYTRLLPQIQGLPGVSAAGASTDLPLSVRERRAFTIENEAAESREMPHSLACQWTLGDYFRAMGIALKSGRYLSEQDHAQSEPVAVINETLARQYFARTDPIGRRMAWGGPAQHGRWMRIVGVVGDVKQGALDTPTEPQAYIPWLQVPDQSLGDNIVGQMRGLRLTIRTDMEPSGLASLVRQEIRALDPALPVMAVRTMDEIVRASTGPQRFNTVVIGSFAMLALLLSGVGIAGALATSVSGRVRELGVRLALGAQPGALVSMVLREGIRLAALGLLIGWPVAWVLSRFMSTLLFGVSPRDFLTFALVGVLLTAVSLVACWVPAWRAARVDPLTALRAE